MGWFEGRREACARPGERLGVESVLHGQRVYGHGGWYQDGVQVNELRLPFFSQLLLCLLQNICDCFAIPTDLLFSFSCLSVTVDVNKTTSLSPMREGRFVWDEPLHCGHHPSRDLIDVFIECRTLSDSQGMDPIMVI